MLTRTCLALMIFLGLVVSACGEDREQTARPPTPTATQTAPPTPTQEAPPEPVTCIEVLQSGEDVEDCEQDGEQVQVEERGDSLNLNLLDIDYVGMRKVKSLSGDVERAVADGKFVRVKLKVKNSDDEPFYLEDAVEVSLLAPNGNRYTPYFAGNNLPSDQIFDYKELQPDASATRDVVYDVPSSVVASIGKPGTGLLVADADSDELVAVMDIGTR